MPLFPIDAELTGDQSVLIDAAREFARGELFPLDRQWDRNESSVAEVLPRLSDMGFLSLCIPVELNGLGCSYQTYAAIMHELSIWSPSTGVTISVHNMVARVLGRFAKEPARGRWLSELGSPGNLAAFAISEAGAGSDASSAKTSAREVAEGFRVEGEKMWITNGMSARWFLTLVRLKGVTGEEGLCAVVIDGNDPGVERTRIRGKMGIRGSETAVIHFKDVFVPEEHILGERGKGLRVCLSSLTEGRITIAAQASGIAEACLTEMTQYARTREQFGQPIGKFQAVADMIAMSAVELEAAKLLIRRAASRADAGGLGRTASSMAKLYATEAANRIAYRAVQVHGGAGFVQECRVEQLYRDARVTTIYEGTSEVQRIVIARELDNEIRRQDR